MDSHDLPDIRLFDLLQESLREVHRLVCLGDSPGALAGLEAVVRQRLKVQPFPEPADWAAEKHRADLLLDRKLLLTPVHQDPFPLATPVDWRTRYETDECWNGHMGFFYGFTPLARMYARTRDERYAEAWCRYVTEFLDAVWYGTPALTYFPSRPMALNDRKACDNGECDHASPGHWISLSVAWRMDQWLEGCRWLAESPSLTRALLFRMLRALYEDHLLVLVNNPRANTPNQYFHTSTALLRLAQAVPEMRSAPAAFLIAHDRLRDAVASQVYPDGTDIEQSPNYNPNTTKHIASILALLDDAPESRKAPFRDAARRRVRFVCQVVMPDLGMIDLAKAHHADSYRAWLLEQGRRFGVPEAVWLATDGAEGSAPPYRSVAMPYSGYYVMRSGYERATDYLFFKASPRPAGGHMHEDNLGFILGSGGRLLLADSGNYSYTNNTPLDRTMNAYSFQTESHSTVLVDGQGQSRMVAFRKDHPRPFEIPPVSARHPVKLPNRSLAGSRFEYVEGVYDDGYGPDNALRVRHRRRILWVKGRGWLVVDLLEPADLQEHAYTQLWMLGPDFAGRCELGLDGAVTTAEGVNLRLLFLQTGPSTRACYCGEDDPMRGWYSVHYGQRVPKPDLHVGWTGRGPQIVGAWVQTDASPVGRIVKVEAIDGRFLVDIRFEDGARLQADTGAGCAALALEGIQADAETGVLWSDAGGKTAAFVGAPQQAVPESVRHVELKGVGTGWETADWPPMPDLDAVENAEMKTI